MPQTPRKCLFLGKAPSIFTIWYYTHYFRQSKFNKHNTQCPRKPTYPLSGQNTNHLAQHVLMLGTHVTLLLLCTCSFIETTNRPTLHLQRASLSEMRFVKGLGRNLVVLHAAGGLCVRRVVWERQLWYCRETFIFSRHIVVLLSRPAPFCASGTTQINELMEIGH